MLCVFLQSYIIYVILNSNTDNYFQPCASFSVGIVEQDKGCNRLVSYKKNGESDLRHGAGNEFCIQQSESVRKSDSKR